MARNRFGGDEIIIRKMLVQQTGTFKTVYNRGWELDLDNGNLESIRKRMRGAGRNAPIGSTLFKGMGRLLTPTSDLNRARDEIYIPDGWDRPRCRFMMEVEVDSNLGSNDTYFLQGFSEELGLTASGNIDTKMKWYINSFIRVQYYERETRRGVERYGVVKSSAQVINGRLIYDDDHRVTLTRTVDLFSSMQERFYQQGTSEDVTDYRHCLNSRADSHVANRIDNLPGQYLGSTLETFRRAVDTDQFGSGTENALSRAQQDLNAELITNESNPFMTRLAQLQGMPSTTMFTIDDLYDIDPECMREGIIAGTKLSSRAIKSLAHTSENVSDWTGNDLESRWAIQISNSVSAIMMKYYHTGFSARISNMNYDARTTSEVRDARPVAEGLPEEIFEAMVRDIEDFLEDLSMDGRQSFSIDIVANLYDQTELFISIDNSREQRFFVPTFADSMMTPFFTKDAGLLDRLSSDVERLIDDAADEMKSVAFNAANGV